MQVGYNHNIRHKGKDYHIQTEDSGRDTTTITTLLYREGSIISSKKTNYSEVAKEYDDYDQQLKELMQKQHKQMLINLKNGEYDDPELKSFEEPQDVKEAEDKTILDAINQTEHDEEGSATEDRLGIFFDEIVKALSNTLENLTQKKVELVKASEELTALDRIPANHEGKFVTLKTRINKEISAECAFVADLKSLTIIADLIAMGEGTPKDELSEDDLDALGEVMNQTLGSSIQPIFDSLHKDIAYDQTNIEASEDSERLKSLFATSKIHSAKISVKIENFVSSDVYFYVTSSIDIGIAQEAPVEPENDKAEIIKEPAEEVIKAEDEVETFTSIEEHEEEEEEEREFRNIDLIKGIEVDVKIKLGDNIMPLKKIVKLSPGTIIELNKDVESLLELVVNDKTIANGVLVVVSSNNFALRITSIVDPAERIKKISGV
ncbi:FliM/FliN family flagellar motor switch protein [Thermodesulfobacteriota bacterium]